MFNTTRTTFTGEIPDLWTDHNIYVSNVNKTNAFAGNINASNWKQVPDIWGGPLITNSNVSLMDYNALLSRVEAIEALTYVAPKEEILIGEEAANETPEDIEVE